MNFCYLTVRDVARMLGVSKATVWAWSRIGRLPQPVKLAPTVTRWRSDEIEAALEKMERRAA